jgi:hypothetical protein
MRTDLAQQIIIAKQSIKSHNKKLIRRLNDLKTKCYKYGKFDDDDLTLIIHYGTKQEYYTFGSTSRES